MKKAGRIAAALLLVCALFAGCGQTQEDPGAGQDVLSEQMFGTEAAQEQQPESDAPQGYIRAVWVSYLDLAGVITADASTYSANLTAMFDNLERIRTTDVYFQVRAFGESLFESEVLGTANTRYAQYSGAVDYLGLALEEAHARGMRLHAWFNPYRLGAAGSAYCAPLVESLTALDADAVVEYEGNWWLNPASAPVKALNTDYAAEILAKYSVDGLHFDDYFYPTTDEGFDAAAYAEYLQNGGAEGLAAWRRGNVSELVANLYAKTKELAPNAVLGVSPDASIDRDMTRHYADVQLWCTTEGYIDYVCPQVYFGYENGTMPFLATVTQWSQLCTAVDLIAGLSFYKVGAYDTYAGSGANEWLTNTDIISRQYLDTLKIENCAGVALYRYDSMFNPASEVAAFASVELYNLEMVS